MVLGSRRQPLHARTHSPQPLLELVVESGQLEPVSTVNIFIVRNRGREPGGMKSVMDRERGLDQENNMGVKKEKKMAGKQVMACAESLPHLPLVPSCCRKTLTEEGDVCQNSTEWMVNESSYDVYIHPHLTFQEQAL